MNRILASRLVSFSKVPLLFSSTSSINHGRNYVGGIEELEFGKTCGRPGEEGWNLSSEEGVMKLHRSWKAKRFTKGLEQLVADVAEAEGHHPDLHLVDWNNVKIDIRTHSVGGLSENDFILAADISSLQVEHLLRKKPTAT